MTRLGRYEVRTQLCEQLAVVYRGHDPLLNRPVWLRLMSEAVASDPDWEVRFRRQALVAGRLNHPGIITVYDCGEQDGRTFVVLEALDGRALDGIISERLPLPLPRRLDVIAQAALALDFMHVNGVVHSNIRPSSIQVMADGRVKLTGLDTLRLVGLAEAPGADLPGATRDHLSPEERLGQPLDGRADLFQLGATLYELISYRRPFAPDGAPAPLAELRGTPFEWLEELVLACLGEDRAKRLVSCAELAVRIRAGCPPAPSPEPLHLSPVPAHAAAEFLRDAPEPARPPSRKRRSDWQTTPRPADTDTPEARATEELLADAQRLLDQGLADEALDVLNEARRLDPFHRKVRATLKSAQAAWRADWCRRLLRQAEALLEQGRGLEAADRVQRALLLDADSQPARLLLDAIARSLKGT